MAWHPLFVQLEGRDCLVVGGGKVAARKARGLLDAGARVTLISPEFDDAVHSLAVGRSIVLRQEAYESRDLSGFALVIAATDSRETNRAVFEDAQRDGVWLNAVDAPEYCTVHMPAVVHRNLLQVAIGTGGACPALSAALRRELEDAIPPWYGGYVEALGAVRGMLNDECSDPDDRRSILDRLVSVEVRKHVATLPSADVLSYVDAEARRLLSDTR